MHTHWKVLVLAAIGLGGCAWPAEVPAVKKQAHGALVRRTRLSNELMAGLRMPVLSKT